MRYESSASPPGNMRLVRKPSKEKTSVLSLLKANQREIFCHRPFYPSDLTQKKTLCKSALPTLCSSAKTRHRDSSGAFAIFPTRRRLTSSRLIIRNNRLCLRPQTRSTIRESISQICVELALKLQRKQSRGDMLTTQ